MKNKITLVSIIIVISIIIVSIIGTYAWYTYTTRQVTDKTLVKSGVIDISYNKGTDIIDAELSPGNNKDSGINTTITIKKSTNSIEVNYRIFLNFSTLSNELKTSALKWELYKNDENSPISNGNFTNVIESNNYYLIEDIPLTTDTTTYTLYIWLDGELVDNSSQNKNFIGTLRAEAYQ